ncbi:MAG: hypothetical protein GY909_06755 [Oligoflexia bacterium]|nr:hypothetical protein [Oligoflexia bacterium]
MDEEKVLLTVELYPRILVDIKTITALVVVSAFFTIFYGSIFGTYGWIVAIPFFVFGRAYYLKFRGDKIVFYESKIYFPDKKYWKKERGLYSNYDKIHSLSLGLGYDQEDLFGYINIGYRDEEGTYLNYINSFIPIGIDNVNKIRNLLLAKTDLKLTEGTHLEKIRLNNRDFHSTYQTDDIYKPKN